MRLLIRNVNFWSILAIILIDTIFYSFTNPETGSTLLLILGFLVIALTVYIFLNAILRFVTSYGISNRRYSHRISLFSSGVLIGMMALQSIGELTMKDILIFIPLSSILYMYITYGHKKISFEA